MAAEQILAVGSGEASSEDVTIEAGTPKTFFINDAAGERVEGGEVLILVKDAAGQYFQFDKLQSDGFPGPIGCIAAPGTYKFRRTAASSSCGVCQA